MRRLKGLILIFMAALAIPLAYFVFQSYRSFDQEEAAQLRYFAGTLFDEMEQVLAALVRREEARSVDAYNSDYTPPGGTGGKVPSPLSKPPAEDFIIGYFQNNPDGSFQNPRRGAGGRSRQTDAAAGRLRLVNRIFNEKLAAGDSLSEARPQPIPESAGQPEPADESFAARYLKPSAAKSQKSYLGQKEKQVQELTVDQAVTLARKDRPAAPGKPMAMIEETRNGTSAENKAEATGAEAERIRKKTAAETSAAADFMKETTSNEITKDDMKTAEAGDRRIKGVLQNSGPIRVEIDPMQSVFIDTDLILVYRRIVLDNRVFRQGFVIQTAAFLKHLTISRFSRQPMSRFTRLTLSAKDGGRNIGELSDGAAAAAPKFSMARTFPRPFSFLTATLTCRDLPRSPGRDTLNIMIAILTGVVLAGFFAIYRSAQALVDLSDRRSKFVSSVTHELKTPLTNIRMYVEMLEQGIARTPEREQEYFRILGSESGRLGRLINNILEFSKLEKKQLRLNLQAGSLDEVIREALRIMEETLKKEDFTFETRLDEVAAVFDREMMIQVLINLLENSIKFGREQDIRCITVRLHGDGKWARIDVSDTGPGIPRHDLKRVFDDFYRVENALIRSTRGTGIGLAFVRKVMTAMGGRVSAANNDGPGCTLTLWLPRETR